MSFRLTLFPDAIGQRVNDYVFILVVVVRNVKDERGQRIGYWVASSSSSFHVSLSLSLAPKGGNFQRSVKPREHVTTGGYSQSSSDGLCANVGVSCSSTITSVAELSWTLDPVASDRKPSLSGGRNKRNS